MRKSIALKIFSIALILLALMACVTGVSSVYLDAVSGEARELAHYYLPIEQRTQWAARHSSAELLHFERLLNLQRSGAPPERVAAERARMEERSTGVDTVIQEALALVAKARADRSVDADKPTLSILEQELPQVAEAHREMAATIRNYLAQGVDAGPPGPARMLLEDVLAHQRMRINTEITDVNKVLSALTADSAQQVIDLERKAAMLTWGITAFAIALGLAIGAYITRMLVRPVRDLISGTDAVREGHLDVQIRVRTSDELETLADSFNHMIGGLRQKEEIQATFGKYVDPRIVKNLIEDGRAAQAGERRPMTVYFSDLEGFTALCERLTPDAAVRFLNAYFNALSTPILEWNGLIDKYIGDAIMAFWGPPFSEPAEHARLACEAALAQLARMQEFRREVPDLIGLRKDLPRLHMRMGIATGEVTIGNVGSERLKGYTVIGDTVNLAARLESAGKQYGTSILVSEDTWAAARDTFDFREIDRIRVVGRSEPLSIYELLAHKGSVPAPLRDALPHFAEALAAYRAGELAAARPAWEECARLAPNDPVPRAFLARCARLESEGLPSGWDGVWTLTAK